MRRTASSTRRVGWRATACSAVYTFKPPGNMLWWMYSFFCHLLPVSRTFSAFTTTTKSPVSAWGVKVGLCLPRSMLAICVAARPRTLSFTSTTTQFRWAVCLLNIRVFIEGPRASRGRAAEKGRSDTRSVRTCQYRRSSASTSGLPQSPELLLPLRPERVETLLDARFLAAVARLVEGAPAQLVGQVLLGHVVALEVVRVLVSARVSHRLHQRRRRVAQLQRNRERALLENGLLRRGVSLQCRVALRAARQERRRLGHRQDSLGQPDQLESAQGVDRHGERPRVGVADVLAREDDHATE